MEILQAKITYLNEKLRVRELPEVFRSTHLHLLHFLRRLKSIGSVEMMDEYEKRKLGVFNQLNFFQLITGLLIPLIGLIQNHSLPMSVWLLACLPCFISVGVLIFNHYRKHQAAQLSYFILYPFFTGFVYLQGMNSGVELHFILYG